MDPYIKEREDGKSCGVLRCKYFSLLGEQNCTGKYNGKNAVAVCAEYAPESVEFETENEKEIYYRQHLHIDDYEKNGITFKGESKK